MARRVYFAFHYQRDIFRVNVVRNSGMTKKGIEEAGYYDASLWESAKKEKDEGIKRMINAGLDKTTVTCILVGAETASRQWVKYEIQRSIERGNGLLVVRIHNIPDVNKKTDSFGVNPLHEFTVGANKTSASTTYKWYDWVTEDGYNNFGTWVEEAANIAGR